MASRKNFPLNAHLPIAKQLKKPFKRYRIEETLFDDNAKDDDSIYIFSVLQLVSNYLVLHLTLPFLI